jgi:hypothetical protein
MKDCPLRQFCYGQRLWLIQVLGGNAYSQNHHRAVSVGHSCAFPGFFLEPLSWNGIQSGSGRGQCELSSPCPTVAFFYVENLSESLALWSVSEGAVFEACAIDPYSVCSFILFCISSTRSQASRVGKEEYGAGIVTSAIGMPSTCTEQQSKCQHSYRNYNSLR